MLIMQVGVRAAPDSNTAVMGVAAGDADKLCPAVALLLLLPFLLLTKESPALWSSHQPAGVSVE